MNVIWARPKAQTTCLEVGKPVQVLDTGQVGVIEKIDLEWQQLFPHKGPMLILDIADKRKCYSLCELQILDAAARLPV